MKLLFLLFVFSAFFVQVYQQAQRMDGRTMCIACSLTVNKILAALDKKPELKHVPITVCRISSCSARQLKRASMTCKQRT